MNAMSPALTLDPDLLTRVLAAIEEQGAIEVVRP